MQDTMVDLNQLRLQVQRALLEAGEFPFAASRPARREKEHLYKLVNRRLER